MNLFTRLIYFSVLLLSGSSISIAQLSDNRNDNKDTIKVYIIPGIEIIGDRKFDVFKYPGTAYTISENDLNLIQPISTEEILKKFPGFNIASDDGLSNRINVGMRGLYPRRSSRVLLMEDGVPVNPTLYLDPATYYNSPSDRIDALEILKGSAALRYGPLTMGGVINYLTNKPPLVPSFSLRLTGGNHDYISTYGTYGGTWKNVGVEVQALYKKFGGFRENTSSKMYDLTFKGGLNISEKTKIGIKINYFNEDALATYSGLTKYSFEINPVFNPKKYDDLSAQRMAIDINSEVKLNKNVVLTTILYGNQYTRDWWRENDKFVKPDGSSVSSGYNGPVVRIGNGKNVGRLRQFRMAGLEPRLKLTYKFFGNSNLLEVGARIHGENFQNREVKGDTAFSRSGTIDKDEYFNAYAFSVYIANKFTQGNFSVIPGIRIESFKQQYRRYYDPVNKKSIDSLAQNNTVEFLPGITLSYLTKNLNLYAGIHRGFTPPTLGTAFLSASEVQNISPGEENLNAERSWNTEFGFRYQPLDGFLAEASYFRLDINDMVDAGRDAVFRNLGKVRFQGIESAFSFDLAKFFKKSGLNLIIDGNYTYLHGRIKDAVVIERPIATSSDKDTIDVSGNVTPYSPVHTIQFGIQAKLPFNLDLKFDYKFVSEQFTDFSNTTEESQDGTVGLLPSFSFMNISARYSIPKWGLSIHAAIKNITDKIYRGSRVNRTSSGIFPDGFRQINTGIEWIF
ncbi:MAG TPA: TonB-dependent receptor [Ignavibacteria bacterium]|nr:TonB-dependent receptor [Ignavibacteria bacterium]